MDAPDATPVEPIVWSKLSGGYFECQVCKYQRHSVKVLRKHCEQHENTVIHRTNVQKICYRYAQSNSQHSQPIPDDIAQPLLESATYALVHSIGYPDQPPPSPPGALQWFQPEDFIMDPTAEEEEIAMSQEIARDVLDVLFDHNSGDDLDGEPPSSESSEDKGEEGNSGYEGFGSGSANFDGSARKKRRLEDLLGLDEDWYLWPDKITCALDTLMHLPQSVFSEKQLDLFLWLLRVLDVRGVPSVRSMKTFCDNVQRLHGVESVLNHGALGHRFYVNNLSQIISQEMSNPAVRPHLSFLPEDAGQHLSEARQAARWLHELPPELATPSTRIGGQEYFTFEPALLTNNRIAVPVRWFTHQNKVFAQCWKLQVVQTYEGPAWQAVTSPLFIVAASEFLRSYPDLLEDMKARPEAYKLPLVSKMHSVYDPCLAISWRWTYSTEAGNPWRVRGGGAQVMAFPIWLYCDDTSGNLSKKWNTHNSFLFTPAGLPQSEAQKEYNVHFLSCWVEKGKKIFGARPSEEADESDGGEDDDDESVADSISDAASEPDPASPPPSPQAGGNLPPCEPASTGSSSKLRNRKGPRQAIINSVDTISRSIRNPIRPGCERTKEETCATSRSYFEEAKIVGTKTNVGKRQTNSGIKDRFQLHFLEQLFESYKGLRGPRAKEKALKTKLASLPENEDGMINPVWRVRGLDAHSDTPVEILHVVLLGFVKYFWRDVIKNQLKNKAPKKDLLATRLSCLDVSRLGLSPLAGHTLVQYAGSLVGRDFRAIAQVAPFVLQDLVTPECYETWKALSKLIPLIWQPQIDNLNLYLKLLESEIEQFLLRAARWTAAWFNKPKFHILVHLPDHIRHFGPAILFATEQFESFNAVIRAKSVHSNRQAPSRDIARVFAQGNRSVAFEIRIKPDQYLMTNFVWRLDSP
ncbi:hypothetical protein EST38_g7167 [Candolleomyces aberdarensis]|uniref:Uncharacterized protein n=1 Tax=Candolleomyces aberdarensis TaxID=2316362 RepID=A0A4Q2DFT6_9AGAR|nr:hypothetical protein EST38_g7167 [Candolleomyces aberdarensis]